MRPRQLILNIVAAMALTGVASAGELLLKDGDSIVFLGDSMTYVGWINNGYVRIMQEVFKANGLNITCYSAGICGDTAAGMLSRWERDVLAHKPTWMTFMSGWNDQAAGITKEKYGESVQKIIDKCRANDIKVLLMTPSTGEGANPEGGKYQNVVAGLAQANRLPLAPVFEMNRAKMMELRAGRQTTTPLVTYDGCHPGPAGNIEFAKAVLQAFGFTPEQIAKGEPEYSKLVFTLESKVKVETTVGRALELYDEAYSHGSTFKQYIMQDVKAEF